MAVTAASAIVTTPVHHNDPVVVFEQWRWRNMKISSAPTGWRMTREQA